MLFLTLNNTMSINIFQWNINGYKNNYNELAILIKKFNPKIISLQETHIHDTSFIPIPINFSMYSINTSKTRYGGVSLLIHNSLQHKQIPTATDFDAICVEIKTKITFNIFSAYLSPNLTFSEKI